MEKCMFGFKKITTIVYYSDQWSLNKTAHVYWSTITFPGPEQGAILMTSRRIPMEAVRTIPTPPKIPNLALVELLGLNRTMAQCLMLTVTLARRPLNLGLKSLRMKWFLMTRVPLIRSHVLKYLADGWVVHTTGRAGRKSMPSKNWMPTRSWPRIHVFNWSNVFLFMTVRRFIVKVLGDHFWLISFTFKP